MHTRRIEIKRFIINALLLFAGFILQGHMVFALAGFFAQYPVWSFFASYIIGVILMSLVFAGKKDKSQKLFLYLSLMLGIILPVFGSLSVCLIYLYRKIYFKIEESAENWDIALDNEIEIAVPVVEDAVCLDDEQKYMLENLDVQSYRDILNGDNLELKRSVISKLSEDDKKEDIYILQQTLKDIDPEIRFYASSALKKIEENFQKKFLALKEEISSNPDSLNHNLMLGKEYFRFARSGLSDKTSELFYYNQSKICLQKAYSIDKENIDTALEFGKVLIQLCEYEQALKCFEDAYLIDNENWQVLIWRCEAYYHLGKLKKIQRDCAKLKKLKPPWGTITNITNYWLEYA
ncbi:hypothetical protein J7L67_03190 [bacterium]|nr:hypothetical protein [bacterium]